MIGFNATSDRIQFLLAGSSNKWELTSNLWTSLVQSMCLSSLLSVHVVWDKSTNQELTKRGY